MLINKKNKNEIKITMTKFSLTKTTKTKENTQQNKDGNND
jgi:hypothetical protein